MPQGLPGLIGRRVLVTGASGFVGDHIASALCGAGAVVRGAVRGLPPAGAPGVQYVAVGDIGADTDWGGALEGVELVVHAAAHVHTVAASGAEEAEHRRVNALGTARLAAQAAERGVRRVVFLSSIKVNGERTIERAFRATDRPAPSDAYGRSKLAAEEHLQEIAAGSSLEAVIVRPPLVYGPRARANFARLVALVARGVPLPLGAVRNRRSLVGVWNLASLVQVLLTHPVAAGRTWLVSDDEDLSTPELVRRIARALDRRARLVSVPPGALALIARAMGLSQQVRRLTDSLQVDMNGTLRELGWRPEMSVDEGLRLTVASLRVAQSRGQR